MSHKNQFAELYKRIALQEQFQYIPENPLPLTWYRIAIPEHVCGNGKQYYINLKIGTEPGLIVNFHGGGVSWNAYTAARPIAPENTESEGFYFNQAFPISDPGINQGIGCNREENVFRNWSVICINYTSADFHIGTGDYAYTAPDGSQKILHHHGYTNFLAGMEYAMRYISSPKKMLICGESAGAFATYLLADDLICMFPSCQNITVCADSAMLLWDGWKKTALEQWKAPEHLASHLTERNYTLGCMLHLYRKYAGRIHYLYLSSIRDAALSSYQEVLEGRTLSYVKSAGIEYENNLTQMCRRLMKEIPGCGLYIFDDIPYPGVGEGLTLHTLLLTDYVWSHRTENITAIQWLRNAVEGNIEQVFCDRMKQNLL